jgi:hypothetical protein
MYNHGKKVWLPVVLKIKVLGMRKHERDEIPLGSISTTKVNPP